MTSKKVQTLVAAAFFVALDIIVARYLGFEIPFPVFGVIKVDFQLIVAALCGYALGPLWGCLTLVTSDLLGALLNSGSIGFFFGFTISAAVRGLLFGLLLHQKQVSRKRIVFSASLVYLSADLLLNTLWLSILTHAPYFPLLGARVAPKLIWMSVEIGVSFLLIRAFEIFRIRRAAS